MRIRGAYGKKDVQSSPQTLGERLRRIRIAWGWSQGRFAEALGSNQRLVSHWERDIVKPSGAALTAISSLIGMTTEALLTGKGFTIPDIPAGVEGVNREKVTQYAALARSLPKSTKGCITVMDIDTLEAKPLTLEATIKALKALRETDKEIWVVTRSRKESGKP